MMIKRSWVVFAATLWSIMPASRAAALKYKPKPEETLSHIALIHYGDPKKFVYLTAVNGLSDPDKLPGGKTFWIPTVWKYRLKKGDSLSSIATRYLKDSSRSEFLAWLNRIRHPKDLKSGALINIPFLIRHRVQQGQTMVDVARRYYFKSKPTGLLRKFNGKRTNALKPGEMVLIPIFDSQASFDKVKERLKGYQEREAKVAAKARERTQQQADVKSSAAAASSQETKSDGRKSSVAAVARILEADGGDKNDRVTPAGDAVLIRKGFTFYRNGEYDLARANLMRVLEKDKLSQADEAEAREILACCLVALDRNQEAEHEFVRLLMVAPERTLDPVTTSPKILDVFKRARGAR